MRIPPKLKKNDKVAIVATAFKVDIPELDAGIALLEQWGLQVVLGNTIGLEDHQFAGSDQERTNDLQHQLDDPEIKAIWCARGGYGTIRLIDGLDFTQFRHHPKWIIGYSDTTVLHNLMHNMGYCSIHATTPRDIPSNSAAAVKSLYNALFQTHLDYEVYSIKGHVPGSSTGTLVGGSLSVLYSVLGSVTTLVTQEKILFLEDVDENLYHVDRMMMNLKRNGYFDDLAGMIIGSFTGMKDNDIPYGNTAREIILDVLRGVDFPIVFDFPAGHLPDNRALIFGKTLEMTVHDTEARLRFLSD